MRVPTILGTLACVLSAPATAQSAGDERHLHTDTGFEHHLIAPEMIMQHQSELEITAEQRSQITEAIQATQSEVIEMQWAMEDANRRLSDLLMETTIDRQVALEQIDQVLNRESGIGNRESGIANQLSVVCCLSSVLAVPLSVVSR